MSRAIRLFVIVALVLGGASLAAQNQKKTDPKKSAQEKPAPPKPSFSGHWVTTDAPKGQATELLVTQDEKQLAHQRPDGSHKTVYQLDGVDRRLPLPSNAAMGKGITETASAKWDGNRIVIVTTISYPQMRTQSKDIWSIDTKGRLMIETTETGAPTTRVIFTKKP